MLYVCIPSYNEAPTIGLLLWKIRQTFTAFPREYQLLVADDASTDATASVASAHGARVVRAGSAAKPVIWVHVDEDVRRWVCERSGDTDQLINDLLRTAMRKELKGGST